MDSASPATEENATAAPEAEIGRPDSSTQPEEGRAAPNEQGYPPVPETIELSEGSAPVVSSVPEANAKMAQPEPSEGAQGLPPAEKDEEAAAAASALDKLAEPLSRSAELADAELVSRVTELCLSRGVFAFSRPSVLVSALHLEDCVSPDRAGRWGIRRFLLPAVSLERPPGPEEDPAASASFFNQLHGATLTTLSATATLGSSVATGAVNWGSWLLQPAINAVQSTASFLAQQAARAASHRLITGAPQSDAAPGAASVNEASTAGDTKSSSWAQVSRESNGGGARPEDGDSAFSFGLTEQNNLSEAIDATWRTVVQIPDGAPASALRVVFRPALHRVAARITRNLIESTQTQGALARVLPWDEWTERILVTEGVAHVDEITNFLVNHVQVVRPLQCALGRGLFLAAQLSDEATAQLWPTECATAILEYKLRRTSLDNAVASWEEELQDLKDRVAHAGDSAAANDVKRRDELQKLLNKNKLAQIELSKTLKRAEASSECDPKAAVQLIRSRLEHFGDLSAYPCTAVDP